MGNILFFTPDFPLNSPGHIYFDFVESLLIENNSVIVFVPIERKFNEKSSILIYSNLKIIRYKFLNFRGKVSFFEKGLAFLIYPYYLIFTLLKNNIHLSVIDLAVFVTLPITYHPLIKYIKNLSNRAFIYVMHKDMFPKSAVDLGYIKKDSLIYRIFRFFEVSLYKNADKIGVISEKNKVQILNNNKFLNQIKVEIFNNSIIPKNNFDVFSNTFWKNSILEQFGIPKNKVLFIYGGNISRAQNVDFIIECIKKIQSISGAFFIFIGSGNGFDKLRDFIYQNHPENIKIFNSLPKIEYDKLLSACDVGLVFLDYRFEIANIPSRILTHFDNFQPILAATDIFTDLKEIITINKIGYWCPSNSPEMFYLLINNIIQNKNEIHFYGKNAKSYLMKECNSLLNTRKITKYIGN
jgi:glycosyltransferase involved in cell wall biosynthesis